jgi:hypothetical protein
VGRGRSGCNHGRFVELRDVDALHLARALTLAPRDRQDLK